MRVEFQPKTRRHVMASKVYSSRDQIRDCELKLVSLWLFSSQPAWRSHARCKVIFSSTSIEKWATRARLRALHTNDLGHMLCSWEVVADNSLFSRCHDLAPWLQQTNASQSMYRAGPASSYTLHMSRIWNKAHRHYRLIKPASTNTIGLLGCEGRTYHSWPHCEHRTV